MRKNADTKFGSLSWAEVVSDSNESPTSRVGHSLIYLDNNLYLFGGKDDYTASNELWQYHVTASVWTKLSFSGRKPPRRFNHNAILYDKKMFVFGGSLDSNFSLWVFDFTIFEWDMYECDDSWPCNRHSQSATLLNGHVYMYGGYTYLGSESDELWSYDLEDNTWVRIKATTASGEKPPPMFGHSAVCHTSAMWLFGGSYERDILSDLWSYDIELRQWRHVTQSHSPPPLYYHVAIVTGEVMLTYGGFDESVKSYRGMWKFNFETEEWTQIVSSELPPLAGHAVVVSYIKSTDNGEMTTKSLFSKVHSTEIDNKLLNSSVTVESKDLEKLLKLENNSPRNTRHSTRSAAVTINDGKDVANLEGFISQKMLPVTPGDIELRPITSRSTRSAGSGYSLPGMVDETGSQHENALEVISTGYTVNSPGHTVSSPTHVNDASSPPTQRLHHAVYENRNVIEQESYWLAEPDIVFSDLESAPGFCVNNPLYNDDNIEPTSREEQLSKTITFYNSEVLGDPKVDHSDSGSQGSRSSLRKKKQYKRGFNTEFYIVGHGQEALPKSVVLYRCKIG